MWCAGRPRPHGSSVVFAFLSGKALVFLLSKNGHRTPLARDVSSRAVGGARLPRGAFVFFLALAFFFQTYVAGTHIHGVSDPIISLLHNQAAKNGPQKSPLGDPDANCPFCAAVAHAGAFFTPLVPTILPPVAVLLSIATPQPHIVAPKRSAVYSWHQRAPPYV